jgi:tetratricopeptide (TPR) repeat protein
MGREDLDGDLLQELADILRKIYPFARESAIEFEVSMRKHHFGATTDLRDALDHIAMFFKEESSREDKREHLTNVKEHLRRAAVEPQQYMVEKKILELEGRLKVLKYGWLLLVRSSISIEEAENALKMAIEYLEKGRSLKGHENFEEAISCFKQANKILQETLDHIPETKVLQDRLFSIALAVAMLILGVVLGKVW